MIQIGAVDFRLDNKLGTGGTSYLSGVADQTVGAGGVASIDFTSIPATHKHLLLIGSRRSERALGYEFTYIRFNSDTGSNYWVARHFYYNGTTIDQSHTAAQSIMMGYSSAASSAASSFTPFWLWIPDYASTSKYKTVIGRSFTFGGHSGTTDVYPSYHNGVWRNTAAISSVSLFGASGDYAQYSRVTLYGVS